jgi:hypothetical protein
MKSEMYAYFYNFKREYMELKFKIVTKNFNFSLRYSVPIFLKYIIYEYIHNYQQINTLKFTNYAFNNNKYPQLYEFEAI